MKMVSILNTSRFIMAVLLCGILFIPLSATTAGFDFKVVSNFYLIINTLIENIGFN